MPPKHITSPHNSIIKMVASLRERSAREEYGLAILEGVKEFTRAKETGLKLHQIFVYEEGLRPEERIILDTYPLKGVERYDVSKSVFSKIAFGVRKKGLLATFKVRSRSLTTFQIPKNPFLVVIESVEKPGNFGAILRICDGAGVDGVINCDKVTDIYNPNVIRASMGTVFSLPVFEADSKETLRILKENKLPIFVTRPQVKDIYTQADYAKGCVLVFGSEKDGASSVWDDHDVQRISIPMNGRTDSLNVAASVAIVTYEAVRQRNH